MVDRVLLMQDGMFSFFDNSVGIFDFLTKMLLHFHHELAVPLLLDSSYHRALKQVKSEE